MGRGTGSFVHRSKKKRDRNSDAEKLDEIQTHLENLGWPVKREIMISTGMFTHSRNHKRNPDLYVEKGKFECLIELDGKVHGNLETPTEKTINRNADYENSHHNYILLSEEDAKFFKLNLGDLAAYRLNEEYSKHLAKLENGSMFV